MKKIYNLFLCTIIFSLCSLRAQDNSNNNVKNVPPHASSSNYYPWLIGASIIGTGAIARKLLYNKYKNEKLYQQSVEELSGKHTLQSNALAQKHQNEIDNFDKAYPKRLEKLNLQQSSNQIKNRLEKKNTDDKKLDKEYAAKRKDLLKEREDLLKKQSTEKAKLAKEQDQEVKANINISPELRLKEMRENLNAFSDSELPIRFKARNSPESRLRESRAREQNSASKDTSNKQSTAPKSADTPEQQLSALNNLVAVSAVDKENFETTLTNMQKVAQDSGKNTDNTKNEEKGESNGEGGE